MDPRPFVIAIPVYDGVDLLDIAAPREVFHWMGKNATVAAEVDVHVVYVADGPTIESLNGLHFVPDHGFDDPAVAHPDLLWVPGGSPPALRRELDDLGSPFFEYIRRVGPGARYACSVCEGAVLFAASGLLDGYSATTHWNFYGCMTAYPAVTMVPPMPQGDAYVYPRYVHDRDRVTGGGITSGLDEALYLVTLLFGEVVAQEVANVTQYAPDPPISGRFSLTTGCPIPPTLVAEAPPGPSYLAG